VARAERLWQAALRCSEQARASQALVPLATERLPLPSVEPFLVRRLLGDTPKHLGAAGPRPNPFLPWDRRLEVTRLGQTHVVLLNKYPVQAGHLLVITQHWQPQSGWLAPADWRAVAEVEGDTGGLWFFNSCAAAGASQPHRHLQLLPRPWQASSCPLDGPIQEQLKQQRLVWPWRYALSRREQRVGAGADTPEHRAAELMALYADHTRRLRLGDPRQVPQPRVPYNLLFSDDWFLTVRREREHCAGFSVNALGFAGYLLATAGSDLHWLEQQGPWQLLRSVAASAGPEPRDDSVFSRLSQG
jgi:sulfate adenylyltransferase (ADP) / ATP adenylyltransferase